MKCLAQSSETMINLEIESDSGACLIYAREQLENQGRVLATDHPAHNALQPLNVGCVQAVSTCSVHRELPRVDIH